MSPRPKFPLVARMMVWLAGYLAVLAGSFFLFLSWQLDRGLDSILSGAASERLKGLGGVIAYDLRNTGESAWDEVLARHLDPYGVEYALRPAGQDFGETPPFEVPEAIEKRLRERVPRGGPGVRRPEARGEAEPAGRPGPPGIGAREGGEQFDRPGLPPRRRPPGGPRLDGGRGANVPAPAARAVLLQREEGAYWAVIDLPVFTHVVEEPRHALLFLRSESISAGGLFFDLRPWILGGLAVLALSFLIWTPFAFGIARYVGRLSRTTEAIAAGNFEARVGARRSDELGTLGVSIEKMAGRLNHLVRGQKRFLGDVAHELCAPLARLRTGLGVLEQGISGGQKDRLASIEEDAEELSDLIAEVLAFTRASTAPGSAQLEPVELAPLVAEVVARECPDRAVAVEVADGLRASADQALLGRVLGNLVRNAHVHGGADCAISISARQRAGDRVELVVEDTGPGVPEGELAHLFEPFYRPDSARTREQGGAGLGMAIVRSGVEACGGSVAASLVKPHGLSVRLSLKSGPGNLAGSGGAH